METKLIYLFLLISINIFSQKIKIYDGNFESVNNLYIGSSARATYEYYENDNYERIFHGNFYYISTYGGDKRVIIQGKYRNNNKVGNWIYTSEGNNYYLKINGNYNDNLKEGLWSFYESIVIDNQKKIMSYSINIKNNIVVGEIKIPNLIGKFNDNGNFSGEWIWKDNQYENLAEFDDNVLIKYIDRKISTGKINSKYIPNRDSIYSDKKNINLLKFKKVNLNELNDFLDVFECSKNSETRRYQSNSIYQFLKNISESINNLIKDTPFTSLGFLEFIKLKKPDLLVENPKTIILINIDNVQDATRTEIKEKFAKNGDYLLGNRNPISRPKPNYICNEQGVVVVRIEVDINGNVINAIPGIEGTTNKAPCLMTQAKEAALNTKWSTDFSSTSTQFGTIKYRFSLSQ